MFLRKAQVDNSNRKEKNSISFFLMESKLLTILCLKPEKFIKATSNQGRSALYFPHMNIRSILSKVDDVEILLDTLRFSFSILMFSETWYTSDSNDFVLPNYKHFTLRRNIRRG